MNPVDLTMVKQYLRIDGDYDDALLGAILNASVDYVEKYTGRDINTLYVEAPSVHIAIMALCADMYDLRQYTTSGVQTNPCVNQILGSICSNFI